MTNLYALCKSILILMTSLLLDGFLLLALCVQDRLLALLELSKALGRISSAQNEKAFTNALA